MGSVINTYGNGWFDCWMVAKIGRGSERSYLRALRIAAAFAPHACGSADSRSRGLSGGGCPLSRRSLPGSIPSRSAPLSISAHVAIRAVTTTHIDAVRPTLYV